MASGFKKDVDKKNLDLMEAKSITPILIWCPSVEAANRHQFEAGKMYWWPANPQKGYVLCPIHNDLIEVSIKPKSENNTLQAPQDKDDGKTQNSEGYSKEQEEEFFMEKLLNRVETILRTRSSDINFFLSHRVDLKWISQPKSDFRFLEFYFSSKHEIKKSETEEIIRKLEKLTLETGLPCEFKDIVKMAGNDVKTMYSLCAHKASNSRLYGKDSGFSIRDEFTLYPYKTGELFGEFPALVVYSQNEIDFVLPHFASSHVTIPDIIRQTYTLPLEKKWRHSRMEIIPFIDKLKNIVQNQLKDVLLEWKNTSSLFDEYLKKASEAPK